LASSAHVYAANLTLSPSSVTTKVGKTFSIDIVVNNNIDAINAASALVSFPKDTLQVVSVSKKGSFINLWAEEPAYSNDKGTISLEGVALNPGFDKATGKILTVTFKAIQAGNISVAVTSGSVLANDGNATDVLKTTGAAFVYVNEDTAKGDDVATATVVPVITSPTHPDNILWYGRRDASFEWKLPEGVIAVRTLYSDKETDKPTKVYDPPVTNRSFTTDSDGVFYMLAQFKNASGWGAVAQYKFQVDTSAPESLKASFPDSNITTNQTPAVLVLAEDALSGVAKITLSVDKGQPVEFPVDPSNLYHLPKQSSGNHTVVITALDNAGNATTVSLDYTIQTISPPVITEYTKKVDFDNKFKIIGATYPNATVEVVLIDAEGIPYTSQVTSNDTGVFTLLWDKSLSSGVYEMRARVLDGRGSVSDYTETRVVIVERMVLIRFGIFVMNWLSVILIVIIAALTITATLWYSLVQFSRFRRKVKRRLSEVENTLRVNVQALRRDTEEFHDVLVKAERKRELTKEEQAILKKFKKRLEITEKEIEEKLDKIVS
jgi:acyl-CoA hydrolase